jgi:sialic acid synthase SpsE
MATQLTLGEIARDDAIEKVEGNAEVWCRRVLDLIRAMPKGHIFTTDDLWASTTALGLVVHEPRAIGAVMKAAAKCGIAESTQRYTKSKRVECHARPILFWRRR